jgi:hypothetical protein
MMKKVHNSCSCRPDKTHLATSHLSTCVKTNCKAGDYRLDLTSALDLYINYCNEHRPQLPSLPPVTAVVTVDGEEKDSAASTFSGPTKTVYVSAQPVGAPKGSGRRRTEQPILGWCLVALMLVNIGIRGRS